MVQVSAAQSFSVEARRPEGVRILAPLVFVWFALLAADLLQDLIVSDASQKIWLLDVDVERSVYTWFSQLLLAGVAVLLLDTGARILRGRPFVGAQWLILSGLFLLLSLDESLSLHELLSGHLNSALHTTGYFAFAWVIPAGLLCAVGLVAAIPFLRSLPPRVAGMMVLAGLVFVGGAVGMEMVGGRILESVGGDVNALAYRLEVAVEEGMEGLGVLIFLYSHLVYRQPERARL
jgi:hypothetical protein